MSGVNFSIDVQGAEQVLANLSALKQRASNVTTDLLRDTGLIIQSEVDSVFDSAPLGSSGGTVYGGVQWDALTDAYLKRRPERATGQIYRDTGELLQSLNVGNEDNILRSGDNVLTFGTSLVKASRLQRLRPYLFETPSMVEAIARRWELYIVEGQ